jgi:hypothetical protein
MEKIPLVYVAGALSDPDCCMYLQNVNKMNAFAADLQLDYECGVYIPSNDLIYGIFCGYLGYEDYVKNSMCILLHSDAVAIVPDSEESDGTNAEIDEAKANSIPVLDNTFKIEKFFRTWLK